MKSFSEGGSRKAQGRAKKGFGGDELSQEQTTISPIESSEPGDTRSSGWDDYFITPVRTRIGGPTWLHCTIAALMIAGIATIDASRPSFSILYMLPAVYVAATIRGRAEWLYYLAITMAVFLVLPLFSPGRVSLQGMLNRSLGVCTGVCAAYVMRERQRFARKLQSANEQLELRVAARSATLEATIQRLRHSEEQFALFMNYLPGLAWIKDDHGRYVYANEAAVKAFQTSRERLYGKDDQQLFPAETANQFQEVDRQVRASGAEVQAIEKLRHADGMVHYSLVSKFPLIAMEGERPLIGGIAIDITERMLAEEAVRKIGAFRETIIRTAAEGICVSFPISEPPYLSFYIWNDQMTKLTGYTMEELNQIGWHEAMYPDLALREKARQRMVEMREGHDLRGEEWEITRKDGQKRMVAISTSMVETDQGTPAVVAVLLDITERARTAKSLQMMRFSVDHAGDSVFWVSRSGRILYANLAACSGRGYSRDEMLNLTIFDLDPDYQAARWEQHFQELKRRRTLTIESRHRTKEGREFPIEVNANYVQIGDQEFNFASVRNISERRTAEKAVRENEERFRLLFEGANDAIFWAEAETGLITNCNHAAELLMGRDRSEMIGRHQAFLHPSEEREHYRELFEAHAQNDAKTVFEVEVLRADGQRVEVSVSPSVTIIEGKRILQGIFRDISERKRAEEERRKLEMQMLHAQKLESLGVLAGGIAHDFNNLLTAILGNASLGLMQLPSESAARSIMREIVQAAQRAADLTQQMLAYSGKGKFVIQPLRLDQLVREMSNLLNTVVSKKAAIQLHLEPAALEGDATQVRQVVMNLMLNASDALEGRAGEIQVQTGQRPFAADELFSPYVAESLPEGVYSYIQVRDTGCGMSAEMQERLFDPFFTTKFTGRGLGLAAVLGIVRGHRGSIHVHSAPGEGAEFIVLFPGTVAVEPSEPPDVREISLPRGQGAILIIDDEAMVQTIARKLLESAGFHVHCADDGREGLRIFSEHRSAIVAVLLDLTMPHMDGIEVIQRIREMSPQVPVLVMSGYSEQEVSMRCKDSGANGFIQKPFEPRELVSRVCELRMI